MQDDPGLGEDAPGGWGGPRRPWLRIHDRVQAEQREDGARGPRQSPMRKMGSGSSLTTSEEPRLARDGFRIISLAERFAWKHQHLPPRIRKRARERRFLAGNPARPPDGDVRTVTAAIYREGLEATGSSPGRNNEHTKRQTQLWRISAVTRPGETREEEEEELGKKTTERGRGGHAQMRSRWMGGFSVDSAPGGGVWRGEKVKAVLSTHTH